MEHIPEWKTIAVRDFAYDGDDFTRHVLYDLLFEYKLIYYNCSDNLTYNEFRSFCWEKQIDYVVLKRSSFNETFLSSFDAHTNFIKIHQEREKDWYYGVYIFRINSKE